MGDLKMMTMPVFGTIASQFNDPGMNNLYLAVMEKIVEKTKCPFEIRLQDFT